jgi:hypothetical protein
MDKVQNPSNSAQRPGQWLGESNAFKHFGLQVEDNDHRKNIWQNTQQIITDDNIVLTCVMPLESLVNIWFSTSLILRLMDVSNCSQPTRSVSIVYCVYLQNTLSSLKNDEFKKLPNMKLEKKTAI